MALCILILNFNRPLSCHGILLFWEFSKGLYRLVVNSIKTECTLHVCVQQHSIFANRKMNEKEDVAGK